MRPIPTVLDPRALARIRKLGGEELVRRMIDLFLPHVESKVQAARAGIAAGRLEEVERAAHAIRSSSGNLGADELGTIAASIETLAMERRMQEIAPLVLALEDAFTRVKSRLHEERNVGNECDG